MRIVMKFPGGLSKALTLSYDDGVFQDLRLTDILRRHGLSATFNINSGRIAQTDAEKKGVMSKEQMMAAYKGFEVAAHSLTHPFLEQLPTSVVIDEIMQDRKNIENIFGGICTGFAYPYGRFSDGVVDALKMCGIKYARTVNSTNGFNLPTDWLTLNPTCHHNNPRLFELLNSFLSIENKPDSPPRMFYLWGHSYEFDDDNNWEIIEKFADLASGKEDIWYATNREICNYVLSFNSLQFSADKATVFNPTSTTLYFSADKKLIEIKPGETKLL